AVHAQVRAPDRVQRHERGGGVGGPAAEAGPRRYAFFDEDVRTLADVRLFSQHPGGPDSKIAIGIRARSEVAVAEEAAVGARPQAHGVAPLEQAKDRLQQVVAVGPAPGNPQEQVQLGRSRPFRPRRLVAHGTAHASTTSFTRARPRSAVIGAGSQGPAASGRAHPAYSSAQPSWRRRASRPSASNSSRDSLPGARAPRSQYPRASTGTSQPVACRSRAAASAPARGPPSRPSSRASPGVPTRRQPLRVIGADSSTSKASPCWRQSMRPLPPRPSLLNATRPASDQSRR